MTEQELIAKIQELRSVKPRKDWVLLTKNRIFDRESRGVMSPQTVMLHYISSLSIPRFALMRPVLALSTLAVLAGLFGLTHNSLPGDLLYPVKKAATHGQATLLSQDSAELSLNLAAQSASALKKIAKNNDIEKLAPAIQDYQKNLKSASASLEGPKTSKNVIKIAELVGQIEKDSKEIEGALQTEVAKQEREELVKKTRAALTEQIEEVGNKVGGIISAELQELAGNQLTDAQKEILSQAQAAYDAKDYATALQKIGELTYPQQ